MIQVKPFYHPQVLLLGNGLNRSYGGTSRDDLLVDIAVQTHTDIITMAKMDKTVEFNSGHKKEG